MELTELESRLAGPTGEVLRVDLLTQLSTMEFQLRRRMAASVPRSEFAGLEASADAVRMAQEILHEWPKP
jgi:hypothetical protein